MPDRRPNLSLFGDGRHCWQPTWGMAGSFAPGVGHSLDAGGRLGLYVILLCVAMSARGVRLFRASGARDGPT